MSARIKVFGTVLFSVDATGVWGQHRCIVATTSRKKAAELFGMTVGQLAKYGSETGNAVELAVARAHEGVVFVKNGDIFHEGEYHPARLVERRLTAVDPTKGT